MLLVFLVAFLPETPWSRRCWRELKNKWVSIFFLMPRERLDIGPLRVGGCDRTLWGFNTQLTRAGPPGASAVPLKGAPWEPA